MDKIKVLFYLYRWLKLQHMKFERHNSTHSSCLRAVTPELSSVIETMWSTKCKMVTLQPFTAKVCHRSLLILAISKTVLTWKIFKIFSLGSLTFLEYSQPHSGACRTSIALTCAQQSVGSGAYPRHNNLVTPSANGPCCCVDVESMQMWTLHSLPVGE